MSPHKTPDGSGRGRIADGLGLNLEPDDIKVLIHGLALGLADVPEEVVDSLVDFDLFAERGGCTRDEAKAAWDRARRSLKERFDKAVADQTDDAVHESADTSESDVPAAPESSQPSIDQVASAQVASGQTTEDEEEVEEEETILPFDPRFSDPRFSDPRSREKYLKVYDEFINSDPEL